MPLNLIEYQKTFQATNSQLEACNYLQNWLQTWRKTEWDKAINTWRNNPQTSGSFTLANAFKYYAGLPHQVEALQELSNAANSYPGVAEKFLSYGTSASANTVPFWTQLNNYIDPDDTCNVSACAMFAVGHGVKLSSDDDLLKAYRQYGAGAGKYGDHSLMTKFLYSKYKFNTVFSYNATFTDLDRELIKGPVVIGILHRGTDSNPRGGHMLVVLKKEGNNYICNDPYGSLLDGYSGTALTGKEVKYSKALLQARWCPNNNDGYARFVV